MRCPPSSCPVLGRIDARLRRSLGEPHGHAIGKPEIDGDDIARDQVLFLVERDQPLQRGRDVGFRQPHVDAVVQPQVPAPLGHQHRGAHGGAQVGIAVEQREKFLCARLGAASDHQRQLDQARRHIGFEHGAVIGDDGHLSVLLPERERLALPDADLQLARIELEHGGVGDPGIALEPFARLLDVEKEQRRRVGNTGGGEHVLAADVMLAGQGDRHDAEAGGIGGGVTHVLKRLNDGRDMIALDGAVGEARENDGDGAGSADAAGPARVDERRPPVHELDETVPRSHALRPLPATARSAARSAESQRQRAIPFSG